MTSEKRNELPLFARIVLGGLAGAFGGVAGGLLALCGVLLLLLILVVGAMIWKSSGKYTYPESVVHHEESKGEGGVAQFTLKLPGLDAGNADMIFMFNGMSDIAKHEVAENHTEGSILFTVVGDGEDKYGHTIQFEAFRLSYSMDDIKQVEWRNFNADQFFNLGKIVDESRAGQKVIVGFCDEHREWSARPATFCSVGTQR